MLDRHRLKLAATGPLAEGHDIRLRLTVFGRGALDRPTRAAAGLRRRGSRGACGDLGRLDTGLLRRHGIGRHLTDRRGISLVRCLVKLALLFAVEHPAKDVARNAADERADEDAAKAPPRGGSADARTCRHAKAGANRLIGGAATIVGHASADQSDRGEGQCQAAEEGPAEAQAVGCW